ncbi:MAG: hypothetical protein ABIL58_02910 [Pseudomonadota bacterium]
MRGNVKTTDDPKNGRGALFHMGMLLLAVFIGELFFYTWCRVQCTQMAYAISHEESRHQKQRTLQSELKTELARLTSPALIESRARQLGMIAPHPNQIVTLP